MLLLACAGCAGDRVLIPQSDDILVDVVIAPDDAAPSAVNLHAFLLRAGTPLRSPFLVATRFEMRRLSDGALFDWRPVTPSDTAVGNGNEYVLPSEANYELPRAGSGGLLGRQDIVAGESYGLLIEVDGRTVQGLTKVPGVPTIVRSAALLSQDSLVWATAAGAGGYSVVTQDFFPLSDFTRDTLYRFDGPNDNISAKGTVVRAYEPGLFSYLTDRRRGSAGVTGALGVFGAYNSDSLPARWPGIGAPSRRARLGGLIRPVLGRLIP
jgi:hypothetical protein